MRLLAIILILGALGYIMFNYLGGPRVVDRIQTEVRKTADEKRAQEIAKVKELYWARFYRAPKDCVVPPTALRELECKNQAQGMRERFERQWSEQIISGWIPPEVAK